MSSLIRFALTQRILILLLIMLLIGGGYYAANQLPIDAFPDVSPTQVKIIIKSQKLKKERFTGIFENETTEQVLNALMMAEPFEFTMNKNIITIYDSEHTP